MELVYRVSTYIIAVRHIDYNAIRIVCTMGSDEMINYATLSDADKLDLLRVLYHDTSNKEELTAKDVENRELILAETQVVFARIREQRH